MEFKSVNKLLEESFKKNWERPALSNYRGVTLTYEAVAKRIKHLHITFEKCGLQKGDKVTLYSDNLKDREPQKSELKVSNPKAVSVTMVDQGGFVIVK